MPAVVDIAGINRLSARILANAAGAIAGMVGAERPEAAAAKPLIAATMFGVTTPCVTTARAVLENAGFEVLVFHAMGTGGRSMEELMRAGYIAGVLDITTTELADELAGGVLSAGPTAWKRPASGRAAGGLARGSRHGQFRRTRDGAGQSTPDAHSTATTRW